LYFFWNDVGAEGHQVRAQVAFGGVDWLRASVWDRVLLSRRGQVELTLRAEGTRRPDRVFQGIGWDSRGRDRARFRRASVDVGATLSARPWRRSELSVRAELGWNELDGDGYADGSGEPSLARALQANVFDAPPGLDGYLVYRQRLHLALDSREEAPAPGHGV